MGLFETIYKRRSVRKYEKESLSQDELDKILEYLKGINQLANCPPCEFFIVPKSSVTYKNAPHYVLAYANFNVKELINVGYTLQKLDLYLQENGYGSIFLGIPKPKDGNMKDNYVIMLAFGKTSVPLRNGEADFDRLPIDKISNCDCLAARCINLAPSACNAQSYKVECGENQITISYVGRGVFKRFIKNKMSKIDIGIALAHAELALVHDGNTVTKIETFSDEDENDFGVKIFYDSPRS